MRKSTAQRASIVHSEANSKNSSGNRIKNEIFNADEEVTLCWHIRKC